MLIKTRFGRGKSVAFCVFRALKMTSVVTGALSSFFVNNAAVFAPVLFLSAASGTATVRRNRGALSSSKIYTGIAVGMLGISVVHLIFIPKSVGFLLEENVSRFRMRVSWKIFAPGTSLRCHIEHNFILYEKGSCEIFCTCEGFPDISQRVWSCFLCSLLPMLYGKK